MTSDIMLRDKLAFGIKNVNLKKTFLRDNPDILTLTKLVQTCKANEMSELRVKYMTEEERSVNKLTQKVSRMRTCRYYGEKHQFKKELCPAWGKACDFCKIRNHSAKVCIKKKKAEAGKKSDNKKHSRKVKELKEEDAEEESSEDEDSNGSLKIFQINNQGAERRSGHTDILLKFGTTWKKTPCQLDTGSEANVIGLL